MVYRRGGSRGERGRGGAVRGGLIANRSSWDKTNNNINDARSLLSNRKKFTNRSQVDDTGLYVDARQQLQKKTKVTKNIQIDARQKIEKLHQPKTSFNNNKSPIADQSQGLIPKITIFNEESKTSPLTLQVKNAVLSNEMFNKIQRKKPPLPGERNIQTGLRIAVQNDLAVKKSPTAPQMKKFNVPGKRTPVQFQQMKITTVNKSAIKKTNFPKKPVMTKLPPRKQTYKRPVPVESKPEIPKKIIKSGPSGRPMISTKPSKFMEASQIKINKKQFVEDEIGISPIEGTRLTVTNLHPIVSEDDILELFSVIGAVRRARLIKPGVAEVVYIKQDHAITAYKKYNNRDLDGQPMGIKINVPDPSSTHTQPQYSWMKEVKSSRHHGDEVAEIDAKVLQHALFKGGSTGTSIRPVVFTVKI